MSTQLLAYQTIYKTLNSKIYENEGTFSEFEAQTLQLVQHDSLLHSAPRLSLHMLPSQHGFRFKQS